MILLIEPINVEKIRKIAIFIITKSEINIMFNLLKQVLQRKNAEKKGHVVITPEKKEDSTPKKNSEKESKISSNSYEELVNKIMETDEITQIQHYFSSPHQEFEKLEKLVNNLYKKHSEKHDLVLRIYRWDGNLIIQKGKVVPTFSKSFTFETPTGEYNLEIGVSPKTQSKEKYRLLWLGLDYAGKTSIINRLQYNEFKSQTRTIGQDIEDFIVDGIRITSIDLGGQKALRKYWDNVPIRPQLLLYVIDIADQARLEESLSELKNRVISNPNYKDIPLLVVLNKIDLLENQDLAEITAVNLRLGEFLDLRTWRVQAVSAKTGDNIDDLIYSMADMLKGFEIT